jgi:hypothetical protein
VSAASPSRSHPGKTKKEVVSTVPVSREYCDADAAPRLRRKVSLALSFVSGKPGFSRPAAERLVARASSESALIGPVPTVTAVEPGLTALSLGLPGG